MNRALSREEEVIFIGRKVCAKKRIKFPFDVN